MYKIAYFEAGAILGPAVKAPEVKKCTLNKFASVPSESAVSVMCNPIGIRGPSVPPVLITLPQSSLELLYTGDILFSQQAFLPSFGPSLICSYTFETRLNLSDPLFPMNERTSSFFFNAFEQ